MLFLVQAARTTRTLDGEVVESLPTFFVEALNVDAARHKAGLLTGVGLVSTVKVTSHVEPVLPEVLRRMEQENAGVHS